MTNFQTIEELKAQTTFNQRSTNNPANLPLAHYFLVYEPAGTEKQTAWAMSIKSQFGQKLHDVEVEMIAKVQNNIERISEEKIQKWAMNRVNEVKTLTEALMKQDAKFFIENRGVSIPELAQKLNLV